MIPDFSILQETAAICLQQQTSPAANIAPVRVIDFTIDATMENELLQVWGDILVSSDR